MKILIDLEKIEPKQSFYIGLLSGILFFCLLGIIIILNIKYNKPFSGLTAPTIGFITVYIAYQQWIINKNKLRLDLYDRRYKIFQTIMALCSKVIREGQISLNDIDIYNIESNGAEFLFGQEINTYIINVRKKALRLECVHQKLNNTNLPVGEERIRLAQENSYLLRWFGDQSTYSRNLFKKYILLDK